VIFTHSRGGFIGLLVGGGIIFFKAFKKRKLVAGLLLAGATVIFIFLTPQGYWERMSTIVEPGDDYNISSPAGRIEVWKKGLQFMIENPLTGVGIGNFTTAEGLSHKDVGGKWSTAHNSFIQIGGELGVGGLILFILLFYYLFKSLRRIISKDPKIKTLKESLEVSLIGYITGGFFLSQAYSMVLYLIIGMTVALNYVVKRSDLNHV
jgi:O-antigen ligase